VFKTNSDSFPKMPPKKVLDYRIVNKEKVEILEGSREKWRVGKENLI